jgi:two-component SAPR family response regulator
MNGFAPFRLPLILVVDDETMIAMMLEDMLCDLGCAVLGPVGSVAPALALIHKNAGCLNGAFLDVNLRGEMIYPVAAELLERKIPFVFVTGFPPKSLEPKFQEISVLRKPVQPMMIETVQERFRAHSLQHSRGPESRSDGCITRGS